MIQVETLLGGRSFSISKEWTRNEPQPTIRINRRADPLDIRERLTVDQFLALISFRYIPNRVLPIDIIKQEHRSLRDVFIRRLGIKMRSDDDIFNSIRETSRKMISKLGSHFIEACPDIDDIRLSTPDTWADMIFSFGYKLTEQGVEIDDSAQGSGVQSMLMFQTLHLIDRDYFQRFGWKQAVIWALEEPESSLHSSLEAYTANYLKRISIEEGGRFQVIATTHSNEMIHHSNKAFLVVKTDNGTEIDCGLENEKVLYESARMGISIWSHPLLHEPLHPLILVEGKYDYDFLLRVLPLFANVQDIRISYLELLSSGRSAGGDEELYNYIKSNQDAVLTRRNTAPVLVLLDWDSMRKTSKFNKLFESDDPFLTLAWPQSSLNPKLDRTFHGIERVFPDRLINIAERTYGVSIARTSSGICRADSASYGDLKRFLNLIINSEALNASEFKHCSSFIKDILESIRDTERRKRLFTTRKYSE